MKHKNFLILIPLFSIFLISNCNRLDTISYSPPITPAEFLAGQHWIEISLGEKGFILSQPSSSFFVYLLSLYYIYVGFKFWQNIQNQKSRFWWAVGFLLTGVAAILAGTSYQALGYELKCEGREFCRWTTWWEINYEILQNAGMNGFLIASAYTNMIGRIRTGIIGYAVINSFLYSGLVLYGAVVPIQFIISFEFLEISSLPAVLIFLGTSAHGYFKYKDSMNFHLLITWSLLILVMISYIVSLNYDIATALWKKGIWFTENDVLHVGLIFWVAYISKYLPNLIQDQEN
ncbi:MAG: hypothetical protein JJT78_00010 [Leptospira sp.]|nr:hypothetical protein [Leptospira sp.]